LKTFRQAIMGFLKHFALPVFCAFHLYAAYAMLDPDEIKRGIKVFQWPPKAGKDQTLTLWENHLFGMLAAAHASFLAVCLLGIFREHSHFRGVVGLMEAVFWSFGGLSAFRLGFPHELPFGLAGLAVAGLIVHAFEPGLFTRDHDKTKKS
jgi:hypothetical protein